MAFDYAYGQATLGDMELHGVTREATGDFQLTGVTIDGQLVIPARSFVRALCERFAISQHVQQTRTSGDLLSLLVRSFPLAEVKYRIEWDESGTTWLFAVANEACPAGEVPEDAVNQSDIPSPGARLAMYGFSPADGGQPEEVELDQDWPLLRDSSACHVPHFPVLPGEPGSQVGNRLFMDGPVGTPRPSVN